MFKMSLNRVHDRVKICEGDDSLILRVDADAGRLVAGISEAVEGLQTLNDKSTDEDTRKAAQYFAGVIFGDNQAEKLIDFYHGDGLCVINLCAKYMTGRLNKLIAKVQKKSK